MTSPHIKARPPLRKQLIRAVLLPVALLTIGFAGLFIQVTQHTAESMLRERALGTISFLAPAAEYGVLSGNREALSSLLQSLLAQKDVAAASIHDRDGNTLAVSGLPRLLQLEQLTTTEVATVIGERDNRLALAAPVRLGTVVIDDIALAASLTEDVSVAPAGWVYLEVDTRELNKNKLLVLQITIALTVFCLALAGVMANRLSHSVARPLARLAHAASRVARGELDVSVPASQSSEELESLERDFNSMARAIANAHESLRVRIDKATAQLAHQATHDPLTGLPNRRAFEQALEAFVTASRREEDRGVMCFIDLDRFKIVNDTCGHAAGDELLRDISTLLRQRVREQDLICRIGGDEFALLLRGCTLQEGKQVAETLRAVIAGFRFSWESRRFSVGASIGLVHVDGQLESAADVTVAADLACYAAKRGGRNQVVVHESPVEGGRRRTDLVSGARPLFSNGLPKGQMALHGQRISALNEQDGVIWIEMLLRIIDETGKAASPIGVLASLEGNEILLDLDQWVSEQALTKATHLSAQYTQSLLRISLNVGRSSVMACGRYIEHLEQQLSLHRIAPGQIVLEFPATIAEEEPIAAEQFVKAVHALGCRFALERVDGNAVGVIRSLQPDFIKVSFKTLVENYGLDAARNLAQALCATSNAMEIPAVASEVEDEVFGKALAEYGFSYAQGQFIAAPQAFFMDGLALKPS